MTPDSEDVKVSNIIDKYAKHPSQLKEWCLADFVSQLEITKKFCNAEEDSSEDDNEQDPLSDGEDYYMDETNEDPVFPLKVKNISLKPN